MNLNVEKLFYSLCDQVLAAGFQVVMDSPETVMLQSTQSKWVLLTNKSQADKIGSLEAKINRLEATNDNLTVWYDAKTKLLIEAESKIGRLSNQLKALMNEVAELGYTVEVGDTVIVR